jgi:hypothetical protein
MNRELYLERLESKNGYCDCPELQELFNERKVAENLSVRCQFFKDNAEFEHPTESDRKFLLDYRNAIEDLNSVARLYHIDLRKKVEAGEVSLTLHDIQTLSKFRISPRRMKELLDKAQKPIITYNCSLCSQQIDIREIE